MLRVYPIAEPQTLLTDDVRSLCFNQKLKQQPGAIISLIIWVTVHFLTPSAVLLCLNTTIIIKLRSFRKQLNVILSRENSTYNINNIHVYTIHGVGQDNHTNRYIPYVKQRAMTHQNLQRKLRRKTSNPTQYPKRIHRHRREKRCL